MKRFAILMLLLVLPIWLSASQLADGGKQKHSIKWVSIEEAVELAKKEPRPILVDVYTDWCGYCKRMDVYTFQNKGIAKYISENFYAVKFNAESRETVTFQGETFPPGEGRTPHSLAAALTQGKLSFPTLVYLDANSNLITIVPGFLTPTQIEPILHFIKGEKYNTTTWEQFQKEFKSEL